MLLTDLPSNDKDVVLTMLKYLASLDAKAASIESGGHLAIVNTMQLWKDYKTFIEGCCMLNALSSTAFEIVAVKVRALGVVLTAMSYFKDNEEVHERGSTSFNS